MYARYKDRVDFYAIYIREAHPSDGWSMESNDRVGIHIAQPKTIAERNRVAEQCCATLDMEMPLLVDDIDDAVGKTYSAFPERLYLIDRSGRIAYKGGRGPYGYKPRELEQTLAMLLLDEFGQAKPAAKEVQTSARFPVLENSAAWSKLATVEEGGEGTLPVWARTLAHSLPHTTAAMLELDWMHRSNSPIEPKLLGKLRWTIADANRCKYSQAIARSDLLRAGLTETEIDALADDPATQPEADRGAIAFARKLTLAGSTVTDEDVAQIIAQHGDKQTVAMVLLTAYANFQDRLILSLGIDSEPDGPLPPLFVKFAKTPSSKTVVVPERKQISISSAGSEPAELDVKVDLGPDNFSTLLNKLDAQRDRTGRIRVPTWDEVKVLLPERAQRGDPLRIKWSLVCMGYQPELARGWGACMRAFGEEAKQDRVFEESVFWVITKTIDCFY